MSNRITTKKAIKFLGLRPFKAHGPKLLLFKFVSCPPSLLENKGQDLLLNSKTLVT